MSPPFPGLQAAWLSSPEGSLIDLTLSGLLPAPLCLLRFLHSFSGVHTGWWPWLFARNHPVACILLCVPIFLLLGHRTSRKDHRSCGSRASFKGNFMGGFRWKAFESRHYLDPQLSNMNQCVQGRKGEETAPVDNIEGPWVSSFLPDKGGKTMLVIQIQTALAPSFPGFRRATFSPLNSNSEEVLWGSQVHWVCEPGQFPHGRLEIDAIWYIII